MTEILSRKSYLAGCERDPHRSNWWLYRGNVFSRCMNPEHPTQALLLWSPDEALWTEGSRTTSVVPREVPAPHTESCPDCERKVPSDKPHRNAYGNECYWSPSRPDRRKR